MSTAQTPYGNLKFLYLRGKNGRVVTVVRDVDLVNRSVKFSFSVNRTVGSFAKVKGDRFVKAVGRNEALQKLTTNNSISLPLVDNILPIETIIGYLTDEQNKSSVPQCVRRTVFQHLKTKLNSTL